MDVDQFVECYGYPRVRFVQVPAAGGTVVERDPQRYLLIMVEGANLSSYLPQLDGVATSAAIFRAAGAELALTFAGFGSLVCEKWSLASGAFPTTVLVVEAFVKDLRGVSCVRSSGRQESNGETPDDSADGSERPGSRPQSASLSTLTVF